MSTQVENAILAQILTSNEKIVERVGNLETEFARIAAQLTIVTGDQRQLLTDHEARIRELTATIPLLQTKEDADEDAQRRSRRFYIIGTFVTAFVGVVAPVVTALLVRGA